MKIETLAEFEEEVRKLTPFRKRVLDTIERAPNMIANTWEVAWNGFPKEWEAKRSAHGALCRSILQAGMFMQDRGIIVILPPHDENDSHAYASQRKWLEKHS